MLASLADYNMLSDKNKNVYILVVNPSKYFTNQYVWANIPIITNCFPELSQTGDFVIGFFEPVISVVKKCQCIILILNKKHTENMHQNFISCGHLFIMCSVLC